MLEVNPYLFISVGLTQSRAVRFFEASALEDNGGHSTHAESWIDQTPTSVILNKVEKKIDFEPYNLQSFVLLFQIAQVTEPIF